MTTISLHDAQAGLADLIHRLNPGDEIVIEENGQAIARLLPLEPPLPPQPRKPGTLRGTVLYMAPDFDAPLEEFREYME